MKLRFFAMLVIALVPWRLCAAELSPYSGQESRDIKALSAAEVAGLLEGKGMGYAKAAELNGYPGPAHVLELGEELGLSVEQRAQTRAIFERMQNKAKQLGAELVKAEAALDEEFRARTITEATLSTRLEQIGALHGELRHAHLAAHLEQAQVLTQHQITNYMRLRGYGEADHERHHEHQ